MKTPIQKKIDELRKELYDKSCKPEDGLDMFTKSCISSQISVLTLLLPDEEEALKESCSEGWGIGCNSIPLNTSRWFDNKYGKDE